MSNDNMRGNIVWGLALLITSPIIIISFIIACVIYVFNWFKNMIIKERFDNEI